MYNWFNTNIILQILSEEVDSTFINSENNISYDAHRFVLRLNERGGTNVLDYQFLVSVIQRKI